MRWLPLLLLVGCSAQEIKTPSPGNETDLIFLLQRDDSGEVGISGPFINQSVRLNSDERLEIYLMKISQEDLRAIEPLVDLSDASLMQLTLQPGELELGCTDRKVLESGRVRRPLPTQELLLLDQSNGELKPTNVTSSSLLADLMLDVIVNPDAARRPGQEPRCLPTACPSVKRTRMKCLTLSGVPTTSSW